MRKMFFDLLYWGLLSEMFHLKEPYKYKFKHEVCTSLTTMVTVNAAALYMYNNMCTSFNSE